MTPAPEIVSAAQDAERKWKIPASVSIAQYGLESGWGTHMPPNSNNPFGVKALNGQPSVTVPTHEFIGGRFVVVKAAFRAFASLAEAFDAHAQLLATAPVYELARKQLPDVFGFIVQMAKAYATDPHYADELTDIVRGDGLLQYDVGAT